jgi:hypothetical protein
VRDGHGQHAAGAAARGGVDHDRVEQVAAQLIIAAYESGLVTPQNS